MCLNKLLLLLECEACLHKEEPKQMLPQDQIPTAVLVETKGVRMGALDKTLLFNDPPMAPAPIHQSVHLLVDPKEM